jgi:hypothetical protein
MLPVFEEDDPQGKVGDRVEIPKKNITTLSF